MSAMRRIPGEGSPEKRRKPDGDPVKGRSGKSRPEGKPSGKASRDFRPKENHGNPSGVEKPFKGRRFYDKPDNSDRPGSSFRGRREVEDSARNAKPVEKRGDNTGKRIGRSLKTGFHGSNSTSSDGPEINRDNNQPRPWKKSVGNEKPRKSRFSERTPSEPRSRIRKDDGDFRPGKGVSSRPDSVRTGAYRHDKAPQPKVQGGKKGFANDGTIRLNKFISNAGICSRREADLLIESGAVSVNGKVVTELGTKITRDDKVQFGGETLNIEKKVYLLLNKPKGYITTVDDPQDRSTVMMLVKDACRERIYPVGRLDRNTSGLLLFTNDGEMAKKLTHPSHKVRKVYHVELNKALAKSDMIRLTEGIELEDGMMAVDEIAYTGTSNDKKNIGVVIHSGKNRVVRRLFEALEYEIVKLDRVAFANLTKKDLPRGRWRFLEQSEINMLMMI